MGDEWILEDEYNLITNGIDYSHAKKNDKRNRTAHAHCADEPDNHVLKAFQQHLDSAYGYKKEKRLDLAKRLLDQHNIRQLPVSLYQIARAEFLIGLYHAEQGDLAQAANYYSHAAEAARRVPDWALFAQLKDMESSACSGANPKQYFRAFEAAQQALAAWRALPNHRRTVHDQFEFRLADGAATRAITVDKFDVAISALRRADRLLTTIQGRSDANSLKFANDRIFLNWTWSVAYLYQGNLKRAFAYAKKIRETGQDLLNPINRVRLPRYIALIALESVDAGIAQDRSRKRLLNAADTAILEAYENLEAYKSLEKVDDTIGRALILLAEARWLGLAKPEDKPAEEIQKERIAKIERAEELAANDKSREIREHVKLAWGDEFRFQGKFDEARECYEQVKEEMTSIEFLELARAAQVRLDRLPQPKAKRTTARGKSQSGAD